MNVFQEGQHKKPNGTKAKIKKAYGTIQSKIRKKGLRQDS